MSDWERHRRAAEELMQEFDADMDCRNADAVADAIAKVFARAARWKRAAKGFWEVAKYWERLWIKSLDARDTARAELAEVLEALRPFAAACQHELGAALQRPEAYVAIDDWHRAAAVYAKHKELLK